MDNEEMDLAVFDESSDLLEDWTSKGLTRLPSFELKPAETSATVAASPSAPSVASAAAAQPSVSTASASTPLTVASNSLLQQSATAHQPAVWMDINLLAWNALAAAGLPLVSTTTPPALPTPAAPTAPAPVPTPKTTTKNGKPPPPFLLFDAPMELRHNFMQSQKQAGVPLLRDANSYHYQHNSTTIPPLVDARHGKHVSKRIKNAKEQKRAQKITDLIEQLRTHMENEPSWNDEMTPKASKLHTLSSCADYMKHLLKSNKKKEQAIAKAKADLENLEQLETTKNHSDPESTTSTLTNSSHGTSHKKRRLIESSSDESNLESVSDMTDSTQQYRLDYEHVFLESHVPQVLAATCGQIVAANRIFRTATGLDERGLTMFNLVQPQHLAQLFEIVAAAIKGDESSNEEAKPAPDSTKDDGETKEKKASAGEDVDEKKRENYKAITVPCRRFGSCNVQLYMTVTLMTDPDPRKRCFHCILTDQPLSNGVLAPISPELLTIFCQSQAPQNVTVIPQSIV